MLIAQDLSQGEAAAKRCVDAVLSRHGKIDVLVRVQGAVVQSC